jgi:hypothetical protein
VTIIMVVPNLAINKIWKFLNFKHRTSALLATYWNLMYNLKNF